MKKIIFQFFVCLLFVPSMALANDSFPSFPIAFYGSAKINNENLPINSRVQAYVGDSLVGEVVLSEAGVYGYDAPTKIRLTVGEYSGSEILFKYILPGTSAVLSGNSVNKYSGVFESGKTLNLNMNFTTVSTPSVPSAGGGGSGSSSGGGGSGSSLGGSAGSAVVIPSGIDLETPAPPDKIVPVKTVVPQADNIEVDSSDPKQIITDSRSEQLQQILNDASSVLSLAAVDFAPLVATKENQVAENVGLDKYVKPLALGMSSFSESAQVPLLNFVVYGTVSTKILGAGERAGVVNSYKAAFGKLPQSQTEWEDVIKIANGRWPSERNGRKESVAQKQFKIIYQRESNMTNPKDNAAVTVMSYGLRPSDRNLNSEKAGIKSFKYIYGKAPTTAIDWDIVRAIAYSGATR